MNINKNWITLNYNTVTLHPYFIIPIINYLNYITTNHFSITDFLIILRKKTKLLEITSFSVNWRKISHFENYTERIVLLKDPKF